MSRLTTRLSWQAVSIICAAALLSACGGGSGGGTTTNPTPVAPSNSAPVLANANPDQSAVTGTAYEYDATQGGSTFTDADNDTLSYSLSYAPNANGLTDNSDVINGTPTLSGAYDITITASDGNGGSAADSFTLTVSDPPPPTTSKPNIVFIISDDQGQDSSAQYDLSNDKPITPILDGLAADGIVFENTWVNPVCSPTRAGLISGKYGFRTNVLQPGDALSAADTTLQSYLKMQTATSDYSSAIIGKWHLGGGNTGPNDAGIDYFAGITGGGVNDYYSWPLNINGTTTTNTNYVTQELTDQAISWTSAQSGPWFLWLSYNAPHTPFHLPPAELHSRNLSGDAADIAANPRPYYLAAIEAMDAEIGRFLESLPAQTRENTIIFYLGDNGSPRSVSDNAVFPNGTKGSLSEGGVNVPMIASGAGVTRLGERETALVNNTDFFVTLANIAGQDIDTLNDSQNFSALLSDPAHSFRDYIYTENLDGWAIREARYKLIELTNGTQRLYDLETDPMENTDLLASGADVADILNRLETAAGNIRNN